MSRSYMIRWLLLVMALTRLNITSTAFAETPPPDAHSSSDPASALKNKLATIILPKIDFHDALLSDALEQLREEAKRLDPDPNLADRGANIFLKLPAPPTPAVPPSPSSATARPVRISLTAERVTLIEALQNVAAQAGMKVKVEQYAALLVPLTENTETLVTADFLVRPETFGILPGNDASRDDVRRCLESKGITSSPGTSAVYLAPAQKLVVRNTQANVDAIKTLVTSPTP